LSASFDINASVKVRGAKFAHCAGQEILFVRINREKVGFNGLSNRLLNA
jgi:hypothetical protein